MDHCVIETPAGTLLLWEIRDCLTECTWTSAPLRAPASPLLQKAAEEIGEYFAGKRRDFDLPIAPPGNAFESRVWEAMLAVPYGKTMTAAKLAAKAGFPRKVRQVIAVSSKCPMALFLPSHRIVGDTTDGSYSGGMDVKYKLWDIEKIPYKKEK